MTNSKKNKIGLVGLGYWGKNILRVLNELKIPFVACDSSLKAVELRKKEFPKAQYTLKYDDILSDNQIKAVIVATPASTHFELAKQALNSQKDILVEKPLSLSIEDGEDLIGVASRTKKILMVGHILQFHPAIIKLKELIESGDLGKIEYIYSNRLNIGKLRTEENILWSFAPHDISVILSLIGQEPEKVECFGGDYLNKDIHDVTLTMLTFANGIKAHIFVSWLHPFKEQKLIVVGSKAMAVFDDLSKDKLFVYPHKIVWENGLVPIAQKAEHITVKLELKEPLKEEITHFLESIKFRKKPKTDGEEGLRVLKVLNRAQNYLLPKSRNDSIGNNSKYFVHQTSQIDENVRIGENTKIWHFSHILKDAKIGKNCIIGQNVMIGPEVEIGNSCKIQNNVSIYKAVKLEDDVFCGPSCVFTNVYNPRSFIERKDEFKPTLIKKGVTIGANATVICGIEIGRYAMVGAGALVRTNINDYALVVGVPAKQIGWVCKCGVSLKGIKDNEISQCGNCKNTYKLTRNKLAAIKENT